MKILCIGYNCGATFIARETGNCMGSSPTDWTICSPYSTLLLCSYIYSGKSSKEITEKMTDLDEKGNNKEFDLWAPHHLPSEKSENLFFSHTNHTSEKIHRRIERFRKTIYDCSETLVFLYVEDCKNTKKPYFDTEPLTGLLKLRKIVSLIRPPETFRICYIGTREISENHLLKELGIDYLHVQGCKQEKFWILPCVEKFREYFRN